MLHARHFFAGCALALSCLGLPSMALADIISNEQAACQSKALGEACEVMGVAGACVAGQRCRPLPDGGSDCTDTLNCEEGKTPEPAANNKDPDPDTDPETTAQTTQTSSSSEESSEDVAPAKGGCASSAGAGSLSLMSLLLGVGLVGMVRRRREDD